MAEGRDHPQLQALALMPRISRHVKQMYEGKPLTEYNHCANAAPVMQSRSSAGSRSGPAAPKTRCYTSYTQYNVHCRAGQKASKACGSSFTAASLGVVGPPLVWWRLSLAFAALYTCPVCSRALAGALQEFSCRISITCRVEKKSHACRPLATLSTSALSGPSRGMRRRSVHSAEGGRGQWRMCKLHIAGKLLQNRELRPPQTQ